MNRVYKVIFNRVKGRYEVVSELAKNGGKASGHSFFTTMAGSGGKLTKSIVLALLLLGSSYGVNAATVHDGDTLTGSTNITVTKDDTSNDVVITATGLATTADVNANKTDITANTTQIDANKKQISTNTTNIAANKQQIDANTTQINTNTSAINTNTEDIATLQAANTALGVDTDKQGIKYFRTKASGADATATGDKAIAIGESAQATAENAVAMGEEAKARAAAAVALGAKAEVVSQAKNGIALGTGSITGSRAGMTADEGSQVIIVGGGENSVSIGNSANARGNSAIALGDNAVVMNDALGNNKITNNGIAIGTKTMTVSENGVAMGNEAKVKGNSPAAMAIGNKALAEKANALALGSGAQATYGDSLAIGSGANSTYIETIAVGKNTLAKGNQAIALGSGTTAKADNVVSIGHAAVADAEFSVAIGETAGAGMVGDPNHVNGSHVVIGRRAGQNINGSEDIALGVDAGSNVKGNYNIAIGSAAGTFLGDNTAGSTDNSLAGYNVSLGYHANNYSAATAISEATALGANTVAKTHGTAVGATSKATANGATAIGFTSLAEGEKSMALGEESIARGTGNVAIGGGALATAAMASGNAFLTNTTATQVVSVGNGASMSDYGYRRIVNVADGAADQDAVTVKQLKALQSNFFTEIQKHDPGTTSGNAVTYSGSNNEYVKLKDTNGNAVQIQNVKDGVDAGDAVNKGQLDKAVDNAKVHYYSVKTDDTQTPKNNYNNDGAVGADSLAMGVIAKATNERSMAVGNNVTAESDGSIAVGVGYKNTDGTMSETKAETGYQYNTAIGAGAQTAGDNSLSIGTRAAVKQKNGSAANSSKESIAIGYLSETSDTRGIAMGAEARSVAKGANAIGDRANASGIDSIAIGTKAVDALSTNSIAMGTSATAEKGSSAAVIGNGSAATNAVNANVFGTGSSVTNGKDDDTVNNNSLIGNSNKITRNDAQSITNVTVSGNTNTVQGISDDSSAADAAKIDKINITGTNNTVTLSNNGLPIEDVTIMGNDNTIAPPLKHDPNAKALSNIQILGSNVTATLGNSVYLGTGSTAVAGATAQTAGAGTYNDVYGVAAKKADGVVTIGSVGHERRLQNLASGLVSETSTDAVNGSQLYLRTLPLRFAGDNSTIGATAEADQNVIHRASNQAMSIVGGASVSNLSDNNIGVISNTTDNTLTVKLAKDLTGLTSVTTGDTKLTTNGLTITGGPSITKTGINAGGKQITNVASGGTVDSNGANIGDIKAAINTATTNITNTLTTKGFGLTAEDGNTVHKNLGENVAVVGDSKNISTKVNNGKVEVSLNDDISVTSVTTTDAAGNKTVTTGAGTTMTDTTGNQTVINAQGITITPKNLGTGKTPVSLTGSGLDNGGNQIHNVAAGTAGTDAVNVSQLKDEIAKNATKMANGKNTNVTGTGTAADPFKVNVNDNLVLGEAGTNGIDGSVDVHSKDGSSVSIKDGAIGLSGANGANALTLKSDKGVAGVTGTDGLTRITYVDSNQTNHQVATLDDGLKFAGNTGSAAKKLNETMTIKGTGTKEDSAYSSENIKTIVDQGDLIIAMDKNLKADSLTVGGKGADGKDGVDGSIGVKGKDGKDGVTISSTGKDGKDGTDGHIGINGKDGASADIHVVKGTNGVDGTDGYNGKDGIDRIVYEDHNGNTQTVATLNDGMKYGGDTGSVINKKLNEQVNVVGGITDEAKLTTVDNIGVVSDGNSNLKVRLSKDLTGLNSVTSTTINGDTIHAGDTVTINNQGIDMGDTKITNLKNGDISSASTDAVNGGQLYRLQSRLGTQINRVGASAAALSALHPLDFDPDDKWDFAAGYGNYKNANAVAIGAYYRPNEDTMFSVGGSFAGGENMVNVGVSWKFGQTNRVSRSRVSMAKDLLAMKQQIEVLTKKLAAYEAGQPAKATAPATGSVNFPDVPENHWAYQYVKSLAERGYLKGYPDGEFKGDRTMTRYEYAAIIYRALQNGAPSDGNMTRSVDEFGPELVKVQNIDRFRVDRISGQDNDRNKVERVRINDQDNKAQNEYRDVYGSHITK